MFILLILCLTLNVGQFSAEAASVGELRFTVAQWAHDVRDQGDYNPNPSGAFPKGQRGYAYLEVAGFQLAQEDGWFLLRLNVDVALQTKGGIPLFAQKNVLELEEWYIEPPESTWFYIWVDIPSWAPKGLYRTIITVKDLVGEVSLEEKQEIRIF